MNPKSTTFAVSRQKAKVNSSNNNPPESNGIKPIGMSYAHKSLDRSFA
jgi:hypothetical protein